MKQRSGYKVMLSLIKLVKPLTLYMILAILMGLIGHLCASFITILSGYAILDVLDFNIGINLSTIFIIILLCALFRGVFRYIEQSCNHYIAFKLLALLRDKVFVALRKLCPAKLDLPLPLSPTIPINSPLEIFISIFDRTSLFSS